MKSYSLIGLASGSVFSLVVSLSLQAAESPRTPLVYESPKELFGTGDFDGNGKADVVIVDKASGKYRLGYQQDSGALNWVDCRPSGLKGVTGLTVARLLGANDALALTSPDDNQFSLIDVSSQTAPSRPVTVMFSAGLGPNTIIAADIGGEGNTPAPDLFMTSIYNSPDPGLASLLRNDGAEFPSIEDATLAASAGKGNRLVLGPGKEFVCYILAEDSGDTLKLVDVSSGKPVTVASVGGLPSGSDYTIGQFRSASARDFVLYKAGEASISARPVEAAAGKVAVGSGNSYDLGEPVRRVLALPGEQTDRLFVIFGDGQHAGLYDFNGTSAPKLVKNFTSTAEITGAAVTSTGLVLFSQPVDGMFSTRFEFFKSAEGFAAGPYGNLPTLADNDNITIPDIHSRIVANQKVKTQEEMRAYTNTIPGTQVSFVMLPIKGGEFLMGSPETETDRKADEGPQIKVQISPFWMGQHEVTWNEYELFMYPDEERRMRTTMATDPAGDKLADAVSHPSKPYVEMSFGMGKDGYPAISMTQHAANKYCQWLSAKTGQFYRLPTEAEWEYAARAGTTGKHFFGDDESQLDDYAWYEQNSDFKYQKVGKKKPNPWGLHDIYGNVVEWVLDQYDPEFYKHCSGGVVNNPWNKATKPYPHSVRGGSWDDEAKMCRSAARRGSERLWKMQDPQLPKSIWYFSDAQWVGFRVVRPLEVPPPEEMQKYWTSGVEKD